MLSVIVTSKYNLPYNHALFSSPSTFNIQTDKNETGANKNHSNKAYLNR